MPNGWRIGQLEKNTLEDWDEGNRQVSRSDACAQHRAGSNYGTRPVVVCDSVLLDCRESAGQLLRLAQLYFWLGPLSCASWMLVSCHWQTLHGARLEGRLATWRESEGGMLHTVTKATVYMFAGLFGSFFFEIIFLVVFRFRPGNPYGDMLWFTILPFVTFAPVILLWLSRWIRGRKQGDVISRTKNDPELRDQLQAASLYTKNLRNRNAHCWQEEG
jgi:hypothetical protein